MYITTTNFHQGLARSEVDEWPTRRAIPAETGSSRIFASSRHQQSRRLFLLLFSFFLFEPSLIFHPPFDPAQSSQFIELFPEKRIPCFNSTCYLQLESSNNIDQTCISHCPGSDNNSRPTTKVPPRSSPRFDMHIRNAGFTESEQNGKSRLLPSEMSMH